MNILFSFTELNLAEKNDTFYLIIWIHHNENVEYN